jgi:hypothetical protein
VAQLIQIKRRLGGAAAPLGPASGDVEAGELAYNDNGHTLHIGGAGTPAAVHTLIGANRQVELTGPQTITTGVGNAKTFDTTNLRITGGAAAGNILARGTNDGDLVWVSAPGAGTVAVEVEDPGSLTGDGTLSDPLDAIRATVTQIQAATITTGTADAMALISTEGLRSQMGQAATAANLGVTTTPVGVVPAISELASRITGLQQHIRFVGTVNGTSGAVVAAAGSGATTGPLPAAADPANTGWLFIATAAGPGGNANLPAGPIAVGDLIISTGTTWVLIPLGLTTVAAANVSIAALDSEPWDNVQDALQGIFDELIRAFSATGTYVAGDIVIHNGRFYRATAANGPGAFTAADWEAVGTGDFLPLVGGALSGPGNLTVGGTLGVTGALTGTSGDFSTTFNATGAATLGSTVAVTGAATLSNGAAVTGASVVVGAPGGTPVTAAGNVNISGNFYINGVPIAVFVEPASAGNWVRHRNGGAGSWVELGDAIEIDGESIIGDGTDVPPTGTGSTAVGPYRVAVVNGGTF